ncbi:uncharacterized protein LOC135385020 [Ornithodoros turicata]|uniref:uncharacterized protein LOC135385020 n=1 Tax=Ornithodoros turicata TaxID=34597 RepID=UPI00313A454F
MPNLRYISCTRCQWKGFTLRALFRHMHSAHGHEKNWTCGLEGCMMTYRSYFTYRRHVTSKHSGLLGSHDSRATSQATQNEGSEETGEPTGAESTVSLDDDGSNEADDISNEEQDASSSVCTADSTKRLALLLLKWKEQMRLPESSLNEVANDVIHYIQDLVQQSADTPDAQPLTDIIKELPILQTKGGREDYWKSTLPFVQPATMYLGNNSKGKPDTFQYVSILKVLKMYLQSPQVPHVSVQQGSEGHLKSVFDGSAFKGHKYFQGDTNKLCIQLYCDEFEVCDPLGAKRGKHKLVVIYYSLLNVPAEYRSLLQHIHLAVVARDKLAERYGLDRILEPLVKDVTELETEGIVVNSIRYTGSVLCLSGDNLSSHRVGGFATSFSHGRVCRFCMALHYELSAKHKEQHFHMRSPESHAYHLDMLERGLPALSLYGVKRPCALPLHGFDPTEHLPPDVMHDVHEGILPFLLKHVLSKLVSDKYFSLETLNASIEKFGYDPCDVKNKPESIHPTVLTGKGSLKGSASQKFCLFRNIALYVGEFIPQENRFWRLYTMFREVVDLIMCRDLPLDHVPYLHRRIEFFRQEFQTLFPDVRVPCKMHYILHYPTYIYKYGPLIQLWSMRFEGKHQYFKDMARKLKNFKNIAFSMAQRHQLYQMYMWTQPDSKDSVSSKGCRTTPTEQAPEAIQLYLASHGIEQRQVVSMKSVEFSGKAYVTGCVLTSQGADGELPEFLEVCGIYSVNRRILLLVRKLATMEFNDHLHVYVVERREETFITDIYFEHVSDLLKVHRKGDMFVINPRQALI